MLFSDRCACPRPPRPLTLPVFPSGRHYDDYVLQAMRVRRLIRADFERVWRSGCDLLLTPVTLSDGYRYSEFARRDNRTQTAALDYCTQPANMAGERPAPGHPPRRWGVTRRDW